MDKHLAVVLLCLLCVRLSAQSTMQFLNVNPDAATSAVAGTGIARPATAYAIENNLAAAALSESRMAFSAGYGIWQPAVSRTGVVSAGGFFRIGDSFALAAGFKNFAAPAYSYVTEEGSSAVSFKPISTPRRPVRATSNPSPAQNLQLLRFINVTTPPLWSLCPWLNTTSEISPVATLKHSRL